MVENRNIGRITSVTRSKSCHERMNEVAAMPTAANANAMMSAAGSASSAHHESSRPEPGEHADRKPSA